MKTYEFRRQVLVQLWTNETFSVESNSEQEAKTALLTAIENGTVEHYSHCDFEYCYETATDLRDEWIDENDNVIKKD